MKKDPALAGLSGLLDRAAGRDEEAFGQYLTSLGGLNATQLGLLVTAFPAARCQALILGSAATAKHWWQGLKLPIRKLLVAVTPGLIGNLNGASYTVRDEANRNLLRWLEKHAGNVTFNIPGMGTTIKNGLTYGQNLRRIYLTNKETN